MIFKVEHRIAYSYSDPVFLEPHLIRLRPRPDPSLEVKAFSMAVDPGPEGTHDLVDQEGNLASCFWFRDHTDSLAVATSFEARVCWTDPFGYLVTHPPFLRLPATYPAAEAEALVPYFASQTTDGAVAAFTDSFIGEAGGETLDFLYALCAGISSSFTVEIRDEGPAWSAAETLRRRRGACRDLAVLFIESCRSAGLAARFVSGYQEGDPSMDRRHLHAWAEIYVPGGGWRGYDPTLGLAVTDRHLPLAASRYPDGAAPVSGSFRGTGVTAELAFHIVLEVAPG